jgi:superfamily II DNA or RNA helicase
MKLRDYQDKIADRSVSILHSYGLVYLAMQVRTGKTHTSLATAQRYGARSVLFITKKKAIKSIDTDYQQGGYTFNLLVTNYESLHKVNGNFDLIIADEAHSLGKYPKPALRTTTLKAIAENKPIIYLSGTPTPESYSQIFHQLYVSSFSPFKQYRSTTTEHKTTENQESVGERSDRIGNISRPVVPRHG